MIVVDDKDGKRSGRGGRQIHSAGSRAVIAVVVYGESRITGKRRVLKVDGRRVVLDSHNPVQVAIAGVVGPGGGKKRGAAEQATRRHSNQQRGAQSAG